MLCKRAQNWLCERLHNSQIFIYSPRRIESKRRMVKARTITIGAPDNFQTITIGIPLRELFLLARLLANYYYWRSYGFSSDWRNLTCSVAALYLESPKHEK